MPNNKSVFFYCDFSYKYVCLFSWCVVEAWDGEVMTVVNKHGQEYLCFLPAVPAISESDVKRDDDILDQQVDISGVFNGVKLNYLGLSLSLITVFIFN